MTDVKVRVISQRSTRSLRNTLSEIWANRELLYFFVWKEIKIRYKQTAIGATWAILQPLLTMVIFTAVFGIGLGIKTGDVPYPIFVYSGLLLWIYFSTSVNNASSSIVSNAQLLSKVYFPRMLLPLSACLVGLLDFALASMILIVMMFYFNIAPTLWLLLILLPLLLSMLLGAGLGFWLSAVSAKYRDVHYIVPFSIQLLLFASPVIYPPSLVGGSWSWILTINPLAGIINFQRAIVLGTGVTDWAPLGISALLVILIFVGGMIYFSHYEREIADVI
ncbi:MAG: ABC transporter permease [Methanomassiliicoccales archaeon]|nr:ABC transporter permease [Methanomassiliicoccales archaeon]